MYYQDRYFTKAIRIIFIFQIPNIRNFYNNKSNIYLIIYQNIFYHLKNISKLQKIFPINKKIPFRSLFI